MSKNTYTKLFTGFLLVSILICINLAQTNMLVSAAPSVPPILYVKEIPTGDKNCNSWADACDLQTALTNAIYGDWIWVQMGTYLPHASDRSETFEMKSGVGVFGGFNGTETSFSQRNWVINVTILSGDIGTPSDSSDNSYHVVTCDSVDYNAGLDGFTIEDGYANGSSDLNGGGIYGQSCDINLFRLTIRRNHANNYGGGMYNNEGSPEIFYSTFSNNTSSSDGGGMYNSGVGSPDLYEVTFSQNTAASDGGGMYNISYTTPDLVGVTFNLNSAEKGGGMANIDNSSPTIRQATFYSNTVTIYGGGMYNYGSNPHVTLATFEHNFANLSGGGMYNSGSVPKLVNVSFLMNSINTSEIGCGAGIFNASSSPTVVNALFNGNISSNGGGMCNSGSNSPVIYNSTFSKNSATGYGGGIYNKSNIGSLLIYNSIVWGNISLTFDPDIYNDDTGNPVNVYDSMLTSFCPPDITCSGNMQYGNPMFVDFNGADNIAGNEDDDLHLTNASPAIDAGNNSNVPDDVTDLDWDYNYSEDLPLDLDLFNRFLDNPLVSDTGSPSAPIVDMGAYETLLQVYLPLILR